MKEEDYILRKVGTENHFCVPDGYFENLTPKLMKRLPAPQKLPYELKEVTLWDKVKPWIYMAAMFVGAALIIRVASSGEMSQESAEISADVTMEEIENEMEYIDVVVDRSMLDDYSLYVYLSNGED